MTPHRQHPAWRRTLAGAALVLTTTAGLAACSSSGSDSGDASGGMSEVQSRSGVDRSAPEQEAAAAEDADSALAGVDTLTAVRGGDPATPAKVVSTGSISLVDDDVAAVRFDVQRVADQHGGQVAESQTDTGEDGEVVRSRMVLRVPVGEFDEAVEAIEGLADLRSSEQGSEIVTEEYVDLQARVRAQEASLKRVELLFTRAQGIRDVMAIESQLTSRQADLDSLKGRLRALEDRTAMSTITVHLERTHEAQAKPEEERTGFLGGLDAGWDAMSSVGLVMVTVVGALLPFAVLGALVALPVWLLVRAARRRRTTVATEQPGS